MTTNKLQNSIQTWHIGQMPEFVVAPAHHHPISPQVYERSQMIISRCIDTGLPVRHMFNMPLFEGHIVIPGEDRDWVTMPLDEDPLLYDPDGFPMPARVREQLQRAVKAGINFDGLYTAHELPKGVIKPGQSATAAMLTPSPSHEMLERTSRYGTVAQQTWKAVTLPLVGAGILAGVAVAGVFAVGAGVLSVAAAASLDPILFGVIKDPAHPFEPGTPAAWFYITHWVYGG